MMNERKNEMTVNETSLPNVLIEATNAGRSAFVASVPRPMTVVGGNQSWSVPDGVCGFAWVNVYGIRKNSKMGKVLEANGFRKNSYEKSFQLWISEGVQSLERKEAYARAYADVLREAGISAYAGSRMD
jgi:hypothetical protein